MSSAAPLIRIGSVIGREHVRLGRNNQDGVGGLVQGDQAIVAVTDGCSSQPFSEVGARLGARALVKLTAALGHVPLSELPAVAMEHLSSWLASVVSAVAVDDRDEVLEQYGLFTVLCAVRRGREAVVFGAGDGAALIDGRLVRLDSGEANAPAYLGYRLSGRAIDPVVHHLGPAACVAVATDGIDPWLAADATRWTALLNEPHLRTNPVHLQRRLNVLSQSEKLSDDTTMAVIDAREEA